MKRFGAWILAACLLLSLGACDGKTEPPATDTLPPVTAPVPTASTTLAQLLPAMARFGIKAYLYGDEASASYSAVYSLPRSYGSDNLETLLCSEKCDVSPRSIRQAIQNFDAQYKTEASFLEQKYGITGVEVSSVSWIQLTTSQSLENHIAFVLIAANIDGNFKVVQCLAVKLDA